MSNTLTPNHTVFFLGEYSENQLSMRQIQPTIFMVDTISSLT
jgi:hypothetical protein